MFLLIHKVAHFGTVFAKKATLYKNFKVVFIKLIGVFITFAIN